MTYKIGASHRRKSPEFVRAESELQHLITVRRVLGLSVEQVAEQMGYSVNTIVKISRHSVAPSTAMVERFHALYGHLFTNESE